MVSLAELECRTLGGHFEGVAVYSVVDPVSFGTESYSAGCPKHGTQNSEEVVDPRNGRRTAETWHPGNAGSRERC